MMMAKRKRLKEKAASIVREASRFFWKKEEKKARKKFVKELRAKARGDVEKPDPKVMYQKLMVKARSMGLNPEDYEPGGKYYITSNEQYYNSIRTGTNN